MTLIFCAESPIDITKFEITKTIKSVTTAGDFAVEAVNIHLLIVSCATGSLITPLGTR